MKRQFQQHRLREIIKNRNGYLVLACLSLALNILLVGYQYSTIGHERITLVPPEISKSFWVDGYHVSPEYLSEMGIFFANLRLTATPLNVDQQQQMLLRYVDPSYYSEIKSQLSSEAERIKSFHITMAFYPINIQVDKDGWFTRITGDLQSTIGEEVQNPQHVTYQIGFRYDAGRLLVKSFEEVRQND